MKSTLTITKFAKAWGKGERAFTVSDRTWGLPEAVARTLRLTGPATVDVCTYSLGVDTVNDCLFAVKTGRSLGFRVLVHDRMVATRKGRGWSTILRRVGRDNVRVGRAHAKFALISAAGWDVAIVTSGNMNANRAQESFSWEEGRGRVSFQALRAFFDEAFAILPVPLPPTSEIRVDRVEESRKRSASRRNPTRTPASSRPSAEGDDLLADLLRDLS